MILSMKNTKATIAAFCVVFSLSACGGGGRHSGNVPPVGPDTSRTSTPLPLPQGHGLVVGELTMAPGASDEHGNVVVSCPAGGAACVVTIADDGTASYDRTGGVPSVMAAHGSWSLPTGHGLASGRFTVAPGGSEELGNVVVSCPAGGAACVVTIADDGTASYDRTGGVPSVTRWGYSRNNPAAADLLDHWNDPETLRSALGLPVVKTAEISEQKNYLKVLLDRAGGSPDKAGVRFRNVRLDDITIIGEKKGITYGQWKSGPAGTLNIEFDYRFAPDIGPGARAWMERAGKTWSWRLLDDFDARVAHRGVKTNHGIDPEGKREIVMVLDEDILVDDITVIMLQDGEEGYGVNHVIEAAISGVSDEDYEPWLASMIVPPEWFRPIELESIERGFKPTSMLHEVGHVLGFSGLLTNAPTFQRYFDPENETFNGPESMRANGGQPVPFQWLLDFGGARIPVPPHTPGARVDYHHPGVCTSLMAYCSTYDGSWIEGIQHEGMFPLTEFDFAFLSDIGYEVLDAETAAKPEVYGWGAWGRYSGWGAGVQRTIRYEDGGREGGYVSVHDQFRAGADAFGTIPGSGLSENPALTGTATWNGSLIGVDLGQDMLPPVFGDAELQVVLSSLAGTARFNNLNVFVENRSASFRAPILEYAIDVTGNSFSDAGGYVNGSFFGPAHEEMAGVLDDRNPSVNLLAGFGGNR